MTDHPASQSPPLTYFAYCRKSSEDERQAASIGDQLRELELVMEREGFSLAREPFTEECSAKGPGRPVFTDMMDRIEKGEADALLCWDIDRLYRNPVDEGRVRWLLQRGILREIRTPFRTYRPQDAGLLMGVEGGRATDHIITLRKGILRGFRGKLAKGQRPGIAPLGYLNQTDRQQGDRTIVPDPDRFDLVRRAWDLMLTGRHSVRDIRRIADKEWGLRTRKTKRQGGKPVSLSSWYRIFTKRFYTGSFWWKVPGEDRRELYQGSHEPMITEEEFDRVQAMLGSRGKPVPTPKRFAFRGPLRCGSCGGGVTAEEKHQIICPGCKLKFSSPNKDRCPGCRLPIEEMRGATRLHYVYYHCTKKKDRTCPERSVRGIELEGQIEALLERFRITEELKDWGLRCVAREEAKEQATDDSATEALATRERTLRRELEHINKLILSPDTDWTLITRDEVRDRKLELAKELKAVTKQLTRAKQSQQTALELTRDTFLFGAYAPFWFREGDAEQKRQILTALGSNPVLKDKKLRLTLRPPLQTLAEMKKSGGSAQEAFEPSRDCINKKESPAMKAEIPRWCRGWNDIRTYWQKHPWWGRFPPRK